MSTMVERVARSIAAARPKYTLDEETMMPSPDYEPLARAAIEALMEPTEEQLDAVRHLVQWHTFGRPTEVALVRHCSALRKEPPEGCSAVDHVPPTNMVSYWIFKGILQAALKEQA